MKNLCTKLSLLSCVFLLSSLQAKTLEPQELQQQDLSLNKIEAVKKETSVSVDTNKVIDCNYHIPPQTMQIDPNLIIKWGEKAAQQSFDFEHSIISQQLSNLKPCYTDLGWESFNDALVKSGNLAAIKKQQFMVTAMIDGQSSIVAVKTNQWKVSVPLQVVYQNSKEKLTQKLTVDLIVGRKTTGDLGIMQMIASPQKQATTAPNPVNTPPKTADNPEAKPASNQATHEKKSIMP